jgi:hypothetical protein
MRGFAAALALAGAGGCGTLAPPPEALPGTIRVSAVERRAYDAPPEPGLWRLQFDAERARDVVRRAPMLALQRYEGDVAAAEIAVLEQDATRELRSTGKCDGLARLATPASLGDGSAGLIAVFKCSPALF